MSVTISNGTSTITPVGLIGLTWTSTSNNIGQKIIDRGDVDMSYNPATLRAGTFTFLFGSYTAVKAAYTFYTATGGRFSYSNTDTGFTESGITHAFAPDGNCVMTYMDDTGGTQWTLAVDWLEVV